MKPTIVIFLFLLILSPLMGMAQIRDTVLSQNIRTVTLTKNASLHSRPVIVLGSNDFLKLDFDELAEQEHLYYYKIVHCDKGWEIDDLEPYEYLNGVEHAPIDNHEFSFTTYQNYIHYSQILPAPYTEFLVSGNYALQVFLQQEEEDRLVMVRRFYVSEEVIRPQLSFSRPAEDPRSNQEVSLMLSATAPGAAQLLNPDYLTVRLQQNERTDLVRTLPFGGYSAGMLAYRYHEENVFPGGNCFRFFDLSNLRTPMYNVQRIESWGGETFAIIRPQEVRSGNFSLEQTLNGGFKVNIWDRKNPLLEADYVWVNVSLPMKQPWIDGSVHIVGALTDWTLGEASLMEWDQQLHAYTVRLYLKQGYYSYLFLFVPADGEESRTLRIEGDHYESPNSYSAFIYSRQPGERFDRLVGFSTAQQ